MRYVVVIAGLALSACTSTPPVQPLPSGPCRVDEALRMRRVGTEFHLRERDAIQYEANARTARVLRPDDAATMDYREDRLNIRLGDDGRIDKLDCG